MEIKEIKEQLNQLMKTHDYDGCESLFHSLSEREKTSKELTVFSVLLKIARLEQENHVEGLFGSENYYDFDYLIQVYYTLKYRLRRLEFGLINEDDIDFMEKQISSYMLMMMVSLFSYDRNKVAMILEAHYRKLGNMNLANAMHSIIT